jgi:hypothetical protein
MKWNFSKIVIVKFSIFIIIIIIIKEINVPKYAKKSDAPNTDGGSCPHRRAHDKRRAGNWHLTRNRPSPEFRIARTFPGLHFVRLLTPTIFKFLKNGIFTVLYYRSNIRHDYFQVTSIKNSCKIPITLERCKEIFRKTISKNVHFVLPDL